MPTMPAASWSQRFASRERGRGASGGSPMRSVGLGAGRGGSTEAHSTRRLRRGQSPARNPVSRRNRVSSRGESLLDRLLAQLHRPAAAIADLLLEALDLADLAPVKDVVRLA